MHFAIQCSDGIRIALGGEVASEIKSRCPYFRSAGDLHSTVTVEYDSEIMNLILLMAYHDTTDRFDMYRESTSYFARYNEFRSACDDFDITLYYGYVVGHGNFVRSPSLMQKVIQMEQTANQYGTVLDLKIDDIDEGSFTNGVWYRAVREEILILNALYADPPIFEMLPDNNSSPDWSWHDDGDFIVYSPTNVTNTLLMMFRILMFPAATSRRHIGNHNEVIRIQMFAKRGSVSSLRSLLATGVGVFSAHDGGDAEIIRIEGDRKTIQRCTSSLEKLSVPCTSLPRKSYLFSLEPFCRVEIPKPTILQFSDLLNVVFAFPGKKTSWGKRRECYRTIGFNLDTDDPSVYLDVQMKDLCKFWDLFRQDCAVEEYRKKQERYVIQARRGVSDWLYGNAGSGSTSWTPL
jgi:hypothetical protein